MPVAKIEHMNWVLVSFVRTNELSLTQPRICVRSTTVVPGAPFCIILSLIPHFGGRGEGDTTSKRTTRVVESWAPEGIHITEFAGEADPSTYFYKSIHTKAVFGRNEGE